MTILGFHEVINNFIFNLTITSVMARLVGNKEGKTIAIRADIMPIQKENAFNYVSKMMK